MIRKSPHQPEQPKQGKIFSTQSEIARAIVKIKRRVDELQAVDQSYDEQQVYVIQRKIIDTMRDIFGPNSANFERYEHYRIWSGGLYMNMSEAYATKCLKDGVKDSIVLLKGEIEMLEEKGEDFLSPDPSASTAPIHAGAHTAASASRNIFVIHGHDEVNMRRFEKTLRDDWGLHGVVMMDDPPSGLRHFLIKFEELATSCSYAVAIFTKDDFVQKVDSSGKTVEYFQGGPNVLFELGWFVGHLGAERVLVLVQNGTTMPTDLQGVEELRFNNSVDEVHGKIQGSFKKAALVK